jgi:hypothetical protein
MRTLLLAAAIGLVACTKTPEPEGSSPPARATESTAAPTLKLPGAGATAPRPASGPADLTWDAPASWQKTENPSTMRKATYKIPKAGDDTEDAELSISQAGGSPEANISRWEGQFQDRAGATKKEERRVGDLKVTIVELKGKFMGGGMPGGPAIAPKPGWMMLGAIVETAQPHFFKLTGPEKTVTAARADFDKMIESLRGK